MSAPAWQLPSEHDEIDELAALGILLEQPTADAQLDAIASDALRLMAEAELEVERYDAAEKLELEAIHARYDRLRHRHVARRDEAERLVMACAERADFGKKKSREVGFGTYGLRTQPPRIEVLDKDALLTWAKLNAPSLVRAVTKEDVPHKELSAYFKATGDLPDGCEYHPETARSFAKPDVSALPSVQVRAIAAINPTFSTAAARERAAGAAE